MIKKIFTLALLVTFLIGLMLATGCSMSTLSDQPTEEQQLSEQGEQNDWVIIKPFVIKPFWKFYNPVRLKYATNQFYAVSGMTSSWTHLNVKVKNIGLTKLVQAHYRDYDGTWKDVDLAFQSHNGNYDVFGLTNAPSFSEFAIKYTVNGTTYWDNNGGANYTLEVFEGTVGGNVTLKSAEMHSGWVPSGMGSYYPVSYVTGEIYINNLSYNKNVTVRYSYDNGSTWHTASATYAGTINEGTAVSMVNGVEKWSFQTPTAYVYSDYKFAVSYENVDSSTTYWDNNFGQNYTIDQINGSTLN